MRIDITKILVSEAAILGIGLLWFNFNQTVFYAVRDIIFKTYDEMQEESEEEEEEYYEEQEEYDEEQEEQELLTRVGEVEHLEEEKIRSKDLLNN